MFVITPGFKIPFSEIKLSYARSSGPGGQNVNKVNSKVILRWNILKSPTLTVHLKERLLRKLALKLTVEGDIVIYSDRYRDQGRNREDCYEKLRICLAEAVVIPKMRKKTNPSRSSQRRMKEGKRKQSEKKSLRRAPPSD